MLCWQITLLSFSVCGATCVGCVQKCLLLQYQLQLQSSFPALIAASRVALIATCDAGLVGFGSSAEKSSHGPQAGSCSNHEHPEEALQQAVQQEAV